MEILTDIASKIGFDWRLALTHLINLLIIFFLLVKFAFPTIKKVVNERTLKIKEGLKMREEAEQIKIDAESIAKEINKNANVNAQNIISKSESSAKSILNDANDKRSEIMKLAEAEKLEAKNAGLKEAENILQKDISKILTSISQMAFSAKVTSENNSDFVKKVFSENYSK